MVKRDNQRHHASSREELLDRFFAVRPLIEEGVRASKPPELIAELGSVTLHQLDVLRQVPDGGATMTALARSLQVSESAATSLVDRLVRHGLVERVAEPEDRRVVRIVPSQRALALRQRFLDHQRKVLAEAFTVLDDGQLYSLVELLEALAAQWSQEGGRASRS